MQSHWPRGAGSAMCESANIGRAIADVAVEKVRIMLLTLNKPQGAWREPSRLPEIGFCEAKQKLIYGFLEAVREMNRLQEQQARAAIEGDQEFSRFGVRLYFAQEKKD